MKPVRDGVVPVSPIVGGEKKNIWDIIKGVAKALNQRMYFFHLRKGAAGTYSSSSGGIKIRYNVDLAVTTHEMGTALTISLVF